MGYYTGSGGALPPRFAVGTKLRVDNGGTYLGAINPVLSLINQRYGTSFGVPTTPTATIPSNITKTAAGALISPTPVAPATIQIRTLSPTTPPTPTPTPAPPPATPYNEPSAPPPATYPSDPTAPPAQQPSGGGSAAAAAAPIIGAIDPAAGAAAALLPAFTDAFNQPDTSQIRFSNSDMPDMSLPEVYNADGTPATPAAKAATITDKVKALPPAAKIGGAVALFLLLGRR
jgi:hypothetical protein